MKLAIYIVLLSLELLEVAGEGDSEEDDGHRVQRSTSDCASRCERLLSRSLQRIGFTIKKVDLEAKTKSSFNLEMTDICWKFNDYMDCANQCEHPGKESRIDELAELVDKRCKVVNKEHSHNFRCIHKYHGFIEVRCSSYLNEASRLRNAASYETREVLQETCRFLHYHNMCLMNTVIYYCPTAKKLFNRFTLRDYFLSFIIPRNDLDFSDQILDYCQVFDFQKMAKDVYDSTITVDKHGISVTEPVDFSTEADLSIETTTPKKIFSSDEDLEETPPNFFYSSARVVPTHEPDPNLWTKTPNWTYYQTEDDVHPVEIEFISHPVDIEGIFDELGKSEHEASTEKVEGSSHEQPKFESKEDVVYVTVGPHEVPLDHTPTAHTPHRPIEHFGEYGTQKPHEDTSRNATQHPASVTKEVKSHINDPKDGTKGSTSHGTTRTHFTLDPNSLLSTIFRIPALFPTQIVEPETTQTPPPKTSTLKDITSEDYVTIQPHDPNDPIDHPLLQEAKKHQIFPEPQVTQDGPLAMTEVFDIRITTEYEDGPVDDEDSKTTLRIVEAKDDNTTPNSGVVDNKTFKMGTNPTQGEEKIYETGSTGPTLQPFDIMQSAEMASVKQGMEIPYKTTSIGPDTSIPLLETTILPHKTVSITNPRKLGSQEGPILSTDVSTKVPTQEASSNQVVEPKTGEKSRLDSSEEGLRPVKLEKPSQNQEKTLEKVKIEDTPKTRQNILPPIVTPKRKLATSTKKPYDRKRPILGGTKIHVKRILHFSEKEEEAKAKNSAEAVHFNNRLLEDMNTTMSGRTSTPENSTIQTQLFTPEIEPNNSLRSNISNLEESYYVTFTNTTLIEVLLALYSLIFLVGFILLLSFVVSKIIVIRKRRLKQ